MVVPVSTKMVKIFRIKFTKWIPGSRKIQQIKIFFFVAHLHVILHPYTKFQANPTNRYGSSRFHKMVKIFIIKFTKWIPGSRKIQEIKNFFFVAHLHVILHPYTKFQVNPSSPLGVLVSTRKVYSDAWKPENSRKSKFSSSLHMYMLFCISIPKFKWIRWTVIVVPLSTKMVTIFSI